MHDVAGQMGGYFVYVPQAVDLLDAYTLISNIVKSMIYLEVTLPNSVTEDDIESITITNTKDEEEISTTVAL